MTTALAVFGTVTLMTGLVLTGTSGTAQAENDKGGGPDPDQVCGPLDSGKINTKGEPTSVTLKAPTGMVITEYCVKAGSAQQGDGPVYRVVDPPVAELTVTYPGGKAISNYSYAYAPAPKPEPKEISLKLTYIVDCDLTTNRWRVRNETGAPVAVTYSAYGGGASGGYTAAVGDTYFQTPYGAETMELKWGDGETIAYGKTVKASGGDADNCEPAEPKVINLNLTYIVDCDLTTNTWRVRNPSDQTVTVTYGAYGGPTKTHQATPGDSFFSTAYGSETMIITWGDDDTIAKGKVTKASGGDAENCEPAKVKVGLELTFVPDCEVTNQWLVTNPSEYDVKVYYGFKKSVVVEAGGTFRFTTPGDKDRAFIMWGGKHSPFLKGHDKAYAGEDRTDCEAEPVLVVPEITWTDPCGTEDDTVAGVEKEGYTFEVDEETGTVTFTAKKGYKLDGPDTLKAQWTDEPCPVEATPVAPTVEQSEECDVEGSYTIPETPGVQYLLDDEAIEPGTYPGPVDGVVTAEPVGDTVLTIEDWSFDLVVEPAEECEIAPTEGSDVCPNLDDVQTAVPAGYTLIEGICVADEVAGVETEVPGPVPAVGPVVAPAGGGVPTGVNAGFAPAEDLGGVGSPLGLSLMAGGLMMLLAAGALQMGRRGRGAHEI